MKRASFQVVQLFLSILFLTLILIALFFLLCGCDSEAQSKTAIYAGNLALLAYEGARPDLYYGQAPPNDAAWDAHGFAFGVKVKDDEKKDLRGNNIRIDARVDWSGNFTGHDGSDLFADERGWLWFSTGAELYADNQGQWFSTRTNEHNETYLFVGVGDNTRGQWPDKAIKDDEMISTIVQITLRMERGRKEPVYVQCWCVFIKAQYQHFYNNGIPGVYDVSFCGIGEYGAAAEEDLPQMISEPNAPPVLPKTFSPPPFGPAPAAEVIDYGVNDAFWLQLIYDGYGWLWIEADDQSFLALNFGDYETPWSGNESKPCIDPNSPNYSLQGTIDRAWPVAHFIDVSFPSVIPPDTASGVLKVFAQTPPDPNYWPAAALEQAADYNQDGKVNLEDFSKLAKFYYNSDPNYVSYQLSDVTILSHYWLRDNGDYLQAAMNDCTLKTESINYQTVAMADGDRRHLLMSPLFLLTDNENFSDNYVDSWGNCVTMLYVPQGSYYSLAPVIDGDYNGDGKVNLADFSLFAAAYGKTTYNPAFDLDADGSVSFEDFKIWLKNWEK